MEQTLDKLNHSDVFDPTKHLGMWVRLEGKDFQKIKDGLEDLEKDGFHLIENAILLNVPTQDISDEDWYEKIEPVTNVLSKAVETLATSGEVKISTFPVGDENTKAGILKVFSIKNKTENDNVVMGTLVQLAKGFAMQMGAKELPPYPSANSTFLTLTLQQVFASNN